MNKVKRTEEQIRGILAEHHERAKCADQCHKHAISDGTFYALKAKSSA